MRLLGLLAAVASLLLGGAAIWPHAFPATLRVPEDHATVQRAIDAAPAWAVIHLAAGTYREALVIAKPVALVGPSEGAAEIDAPDADAAITVRHADGVRIEGLVVRGGDYGIIVEESVGVGIIATRVLAARFVGIRVSRASATIEGSEVQGGSGPYGMGIELANTISRPESVIRGTVVAGATREGIILHNAHARIEGNTVTGNGLRGISISEMSMATVIRNTLVANADAGIYVVDSSMAEIDQNHIADVRDGPEGKADGIRAFYYGEVMLGSDNRIEVAADRAVVSSLGGTVEAAPGR